MTALDESAARRARHGARTIAGTLRTARHARDPTPRYTEGTCTTISLPHHPSLLPITILLLLSLIDTPLFVSWDRGRRAPPAESEVGSVMADPRHPGGPLARMGRTRSVSVVPTANRRGGLR